MRSLLRASAISLAIAVIGSSLIVTAIGARSGAMASPLSETPAAGSSGPPTSLERQRPAFHQSPRPSLVLDESDELATLHAIHIALQTVGDGGAYVWQRGHGLLDGIVQPTTSFKSADGAVCRHLVVRLNSGRYSREIEGIACRRAGGGWSLSN